jgi:anthranilate phosphoribosyltransferase
MSTLITESRFADPDRAYRALIEAHRGLPDEDSAALNTRLVLILANHVGDHSVLQEAIALAKRSMETTGTKS